MFTGSSLTVEVCNDFLLPTAGEIGIGGIKIISRDEGDLTKECKSVPDRVDQSGTFMEGIEVKLLYKFDAIEL